MPEQEVQTAQTTEVKSEETFNPFASQAWLETAPDNQQGTAVEEKSAEGGAATQEVKATEEVKETKDEVVDPKEWLKREFEIDDPVVIKQRLKEYGELISLKDKKTEISFENEVSQKVFALLKEGKVKDVADVLSNQLRLESLVTGDVARENAAEIIKTSMKIKLPELSDSEIERKFNKQYQIPKEPQRELDELDEDYKIRHDEWKQQVDEIYTDMVIDAKLERPNLEKAKANIVFPETNTESQTKEAGQKDQAKLIEMQQEFVKHVDSGYSQFNGFAVNYKDEDVGEFPVSFGFDANEAKSLAEEIKTFDVDGFIATRWFGEGGVPNVKTIMEDVTLLRKKEEIFQKLVNETGAQFKKAYIAKKSNIDLGGGGKQNTFSGEGARNANPFSEGSWSETPAVSIN